MMNELNIALKMDKLCQTNDRKKLQRTFYLEGSDDFIIMYTLIYQTRDLKWQYRKF